MDTDHDIEQIARLAELLKSNGFTGDSRFFRHTLPEFLSPTDEPGVDRLSANDDPSESVVDVYAGDHITAAVHLGPGLSFTESADNEWSDSNRVCVELRLQDVLDQGGRVYPVESIITSRTWYFTLPRGGVEVREIE
jgi:hypothetical protein